MASNKHDLKYNFISHRGRDERSMTFQWKESKVSIGIKNPKPISDGS